MFTVFSNYKSNTCSLDRVQGSIYGLYSSVPHFFSWFWELSNSRKLFVTWKSVLPSCLGSHIQKSILTSYWQNKLVIHCPAAWSVENVVSWGLIDEKRHQVCSSNLCYKKVKTILVRSWKITLIHLWAKHSAGWLTIGSRTFLAGHPPQPSNVP